MNALVTRRALLGATVAVGTVALPAIAEAAFTTVPHTEADADLLGLIARHAAVVAERNAHQDPLEAAEARFEAAKPLRPATLNEQSGDNFGVGRTLETLPDGRKRGHYGPQQIEAMRRLPPPTWRRWDSEPAPWGNGEEIVTHVDLPDAPRAARLAEILTVHDAWEAEKQGLADRVGLTVATAKDDRLYELTWWLREAIRDTTPATLAGLGAKARWAMGLDDAEEENDAVVRDLAGFGAAS